MSGLVGPNAAFRENMAEPEERVWGRESAFKEMPSIKHLLLSAVARIGLSVNGLRAIPDCQ